MADYLARNYRSASPERTTWGGQNGFVTVFIETTDVPFMTTSDATYLAIWNALQSGEKVTDLQAVYKANAEYNYSRVMEVLAQKGVIVTTAFVEGGRTTPALGSVSPFGFTGELLAEGTAGTLAGTDALAVSVLVERADVFTANTLPTYRHPDLAATVTDPIQEVLNQFINDDFFLAGDAIADAGGSAGQGQFDGTTGELLTVDYSVDVGLKADGARGFVTNVITPFL
ncbi:hypothetical protein NVP2275O_488 [Vibrio phage 2.275.O._10N.286.54.E11]|nr:hypothetical protein NVP2275O_488 [Vibrio phage 2.275.O._10N.286.54.E11]